MHIQHRPLVWLLGSVLKASTADLQSCCSGSDLIARVVRRHELTEQQWRTIEVLLPVSGAKGRPRVDDRRVINAMLYKAKTGVAWRDLPDRYGPWQTVYSRFWRWTRNGTLGMLVEQVRVIADAVDELDREVSVDSSLVRAHQHAAGARARVVHTGGQRTLISPGP
ncbi:IS5 family transposase [Nocardia sp. NPDC059228]|uniref:IS5 family transposase n=1 Tax=Nocardia sp. NPDC059228 TaxID=3346777 RepID=UPI003679B366